jgi:hypothetical protein
MLYEGIKDASQGSRDMHRQALLTNDQVVRESQCVPGIRQLAAVSADFRRRLLSLAAGEAKSVICRRVGRGQHLLHSRLPQAQTRTLDVQRVRTARHSHDHQQSLSPHRRGSSKRRNNNRCLLVHNSCILFCQLPFMHENAFCGCDFVPFDHSFRTTFPQKTYDSRAVKLIFIRVEPRPQCGTLDAGFFWWFVFESA